MVQWLGQEWPRKRNVSGSEFGVIDSHLNVDPGLRGSMSKPALMKGLPQ